MTKKNTTATTQSQHSWTAAQLAYLADNASTPRTPLVEGFRKAFPDFAASDQSIVGRRYTLIHKGSSKNPALNVQAIQSRIEDTEASLATLKEQLKAAQKVANEVTKDDAPSTEDLVALSMADLRKVAAEYNVSKGGSKQAIADRIVAAA